MSDDLSEKEAQELIRQFNEGKQNMHSFFTKVIASDETIKTGNVTDEELGSPILPVRTYKELELFCTGVADDEEFGEFFAGMAEIQTSTSLSKDALLLKLAVTMKKELADVTPRKTKKNKGWFKRKDSGGGEAEWLVKYGKQ